LFSGLLESDEIERLYEEHSRALVLFACATIGERTRAPGLIPLLFIASANRESDVIFVTSVE